MALTNVHAPIVVAVDGSPESQAALEWAVEEAKRTERPLRIVTAFVEPTPTSDSAGGYYNHMTDARAAAERRARIVVDDVATGVLYDHVIARGSIVDLVVSHADDAHMIVLGTRPVRRFWERLRPSATNRITGRVSIPVISVPRSARRMTREALLA